MRELVYRIIEGPLNLQLMWLAWLLILIILVLVTLKIVIKIIRTRKRHLEIRR